MSQYREKDILPSQHGWIHELARTEIAPDAQALLGRQSSLDPHQLVEESTIDFLAELRGAFDEYTKVFNSYAESGAKYAELKVYALAQTPADFMIFRNQIKLVLSNTAHGVIQIALVHHVRGGMAVNGQVHGTGATAAATPKASSPISTQPQELLAQVGPFKDVYWTYHGEKVTAAQVARFYFGEFVQLTRDSRKSSAGNQVLLDQIKALLQEKGLNL